MADDHWTDKPGYKGNAFDRRVAGFRTQTNMKAMSSSPQRQLQNEAYLRSAAQAVEQAEKQAERQSQLQALAQQVQSAQESASDIRPVPAQAPMPVAAPQPQQQFNIDDLERKILFDAVTSTYNLRTVLRILQQDFKRSLQYNRPLSVMMVELNDLSLLEQNHGLVAYTLGLTGAAEILRAIATPADVIGRYSENRFIILCPERTLEDARAFAERIRDAFATNAIHMQYQFRIPASIGLSSVSEQCPDLESLIAIADIGADTALQSGDNKVCCALDG